MKQYYREHTMTVSSFDNEDKVGYVNKNKTRNCQLDAQRKWDDKFAHYYLRIPEKLKKQFKELCELNNVSMNQAICDLIEADIWSQTH